MKTVTNYQLGSQLTVKKNAVKFKAGDYVGSRLRGEHANGIVLEVPSEDQLKLRLYHDGKVETGTFDADYFYIIKGVDESDSEQFERHVNYQELTRGEE